MKQRGILKKYVFISVYAAVILACVILDQLTKLWIFDGLLQGKEGCGVDVLGKFLRFVAVYNEGAAFGIAADDGANIVFFVITLLGVPLFSWLLWRSRTRSVWGQIGFAFIVGGALGNAIDRAFVDNANGAFFGGKVRDFISFSFFPPVFNVADSFLVIGVVLAVLAVVFFDYDGLLSSFCQKENRQPSPDSDSCARDNAAEDSENLDRSCGNACRNGDNLQNECNDSAISGVGSERGAHNGDGDENN